MLPLYLQEVEMHKNSKTFISHKNAIKLNLAIFEVFINPLYTAYYCTFFFVCLYVSMKRFMCSSLLCTYVVNTKIRLLD